MAVKTEHISAGQEFHRQFFAAMGGDLHPPDANHDEQVGKLIFGVLWGNTERARAKYNLWASGAGYVPIKEIRFDGEFYFVRFQIDSLRDATVQMSPLLKIARVQLNPLLP